MRKRHWQDWANLLLGLWVIVLPRATVNVMASPENPAGVTDAVMWSYFIIGIAVATLAVVALFAPAQWPEWTNVVLGVWLLLSPWLLGFSASFSLLWTAVLNGLLVITFAGWALTDERGPIESAK
jgi:hypothetical protein